MSVEAFFLCRHGTTIHAIKMYNDQCLRKTLYSYNMHMNLNNNFNAVVKSFMCMWIFSFITIVL